MASSFVPIHSKFKIPANAAVTKHWNNASPPWATWHVQAIPTESTFSGPTPGEQSVEVEVTRVWRRLNRTPTTSDVQFFKFEHEIWYTVKNLSAKEVEVEVYAGVVS